MPKSVDAILYLLVVLIGLTGAALVEIVPRYLLATALVYGNF
jgi:hypothetical protein